MALNQDILGVFGTGIGSSLLKVSRSDESDTEPSILKEHSIVLRLDSFVPSVRCRSSTLVYSAQQERWSRLNFFKGRSVGHRQRYGPVAISDGYRHSICNRFLATALFDGFDRNTKETAFETKTARCCQCQSRATGSRSTKTGTISIGRW